MSRSRYSLSFAHGSRASHIEGGIGRSGVSSRSIPPRRPENGSSWSGATVGRGGEFAGVMIFPCSVEKTQAPPLLAIMIRLSCTRSEEHTSELQSRGHLVCRLLLEKKRNTNKCN